MVNVRGIIPFYGRTIQVREIWLFAQNKVIDHPWLGMAILYQLSMVIIGMVNDIDIPTLAYLKWGTERFCEVLAGNLVTWCCDIVCFFNVFIFFFVLFVSICVQYACASCIYIYIYTNGENRGLRTAGQWWNGPFDQWIDGFGIWWLSLGWYVLSKLVLQVASCFWTTTAPHRKAPWS